MKNVDTTLNVMVHVGTKQFGSVDMPYISVALPPGLEGLNEVASFVPTDLRIVDNVLDSMSVFLYADGQELISLGPDSGDMLEFTRALNRDGIMMVSLFVPTLDGRFLMNRTIVSEMYFGRIISDTGPQTLIPVGNMIDSLKVDQEVHSIEELSAALDHTGRGAEVRVLAPELAN